MFQVLFHGRSGQGVLTAAELLASAVLGEDRHPQVFPSLGDRFTGKIAVDSADAARAAFDYVIAACKEADRYSSK